LLHTHVVTVVIDRVAFRIDLWLLMTAVGPAGYGRPLFINVLL